MVDDDSKVSARCACSIRNLALTMPREKIGTYRPWWNWRRCSTQVCALEDGTESAQDLRYLLGQGIAAGWCPAEWCGTC